MNNLQNTGMLTHIQRLGQTPAGYQCLDYSLYSSSAKEHTMNTNTV